MSPYFSFASDYVKENESDKGIGKWGCVLARREIVGVCSVTGLSTWRVPPGTDSKSE